MTENSVMTHRNVGVLAIEAVEAPEVVTSAWIDEQLSETYERTGLKAGTLSELAGIEARRWWPEGVTFDQAAAMAGQATLDVAGIDPKRVGMLISTSVCKHHLEPSVACRGAPPAPARSRLSELRRRQRLSGLHQRHADRRRGDRRRGHRLRLDRRRRRQPLHATDHDRPPAAADHRSSGRLRRVRVAHARFGCRRRRALPARRAPRSASTGRRYRPLRHAASRTLRRRSRSHDHRHPPSARRRARARGGGMEALPATTSTGKSGWTGTSSTRSARSTPG